MINLLLKKHDAGRAFPDGFSPQGGVLSCRLLALKKTGEGGEAQVKRKVLAEYE